MHQWNLDDLYKGFDSKYQGDVKRLDELMDQYNAHIRQTNPLDIPYVEGYLKFQESLSVLARGLMAYPSLVMATDVTNQDAVKSMSMVQRIVRKSTAEQVIFKRYLANLNLDE